ncbi:SoxR reducing system RseC family protein [Motilimonas cestriensis]|uniref:SoxR reducing system RseC family protein n=1 Tax=Motilimonas cestriensis TaxID=2742685 RepID=A0ABS8WE59_9GAMM|nr:SoxR reducing system RseC family protein [Motilimonas cestriensis]MCE2597324.1 SoxR reducing system RseC family protein [Motilimonas cestriensis]
MAIEQGEIIAVESDRVWVKCQTQSACTSCSAKSSCGTSVLAKAFPVRTQELVIKTSEPFQIGQTVALTVADKALLTAAFQVYLLPLLGLMLGAAIAPLLAPISYQELSSIGGGLLGLSLGLVFAKRVHQKNQHHPLDDIQINHK